MTGGGLVGGGASREGGVEEGTGVVGVGNGQLNGLLNDIHIGDNFSKEPSVPFGNSMAAIHLDNVGVKPFCLGNPASSSPFARLFGGSLVL